MIQLEYQLTLDDLTEASKSATKIARKKARGGLLGWIIFVAITASTMVLLMNKYVPSPTTAPSPQLDATPPQQNLWTTLTPPLVVSMFFALALFITGIDNRRRARRALVEHSAPSQLPPMKLIGFILLLPLLFLLLPVIPSLAVYWHPDEGTMEMVAFAPWIAFIFILVFLNRLNQRWAFQKSYAQHRSMRRPVKIELNETHVEANDGLNLFRYDWRAFDRYQETKNLLKLMTEDEKMLIIPKRAVPESGALDVLRALVQTKIARGEFLPRDHRFPVLPQPVLPLDAGTR